MKRTALAFALLSSPAAAQTQWYSPNGGATAVPLFVQGCLDAANHAVPVSSGNCANNNGAAGTASTTANQGTPGASPWPAVVAQYNATLPAVASGSTTYLQTDASGRLLLAPSSSLSVSNFPATQAVAMPDVRGAGTINAATVGAAYAVAVNNQGTARFVVTGLTGSGATLQAQYSADGGTTFEPIAILRPPLAYGTTVTADGQYEVKASAVTNLRLAVTVAGTGTVNVASLLTNAQGLVGLVAGSAVIGRVGIDQTTPGTSNGVAVNAPLPAGTNTVGAVTQSGTWTSAQGAAAAVSGAWPVYLAQGGAANATGNPIFAQVTNFPATQPVSGTVTVNQGTSPWTVGGTVTANLGTLNGASTAVLQSSTQGTVAPGTAAAASTLAGQVYNATAPAPTNGQGLALQSDAAGNLKINNSTLSPGAATAANQVAGTSVNGTAQAGGVAPLSRLPSSAATTNATVAKAAPGRVYRIFGCNTTTAPVYLKLYNTASTPVPGTTAVFLSRPFPASGTAGALNCIAFDVADIGWYLSAGIGYALTTGGADTDATAPAAGAVVQLSVDGL